MAQKAGKSLTISAIVVDKSSDKEPIIGANIFLKDRPGVGTTTDLDGRFKVQAHKGDVLIVNYIGYDKIEYFVTDSQPNLVLKITPSATALDEVVVVGSGHLDPDPAADLCEKHGQDHRGGHPVAAVHFLLCSLRLC